jgi:putative NADH-flavin reductase
MVSADLNDKASVKKAIEGSAVVFGVTNYWEKMSAEVELNQGKNIVDAAKEAGVERLIWSSLPNVSKGIHFSR